MLGLDPIADRAAIRRRAGVLLQRSGFSGDLTVRETLRQWSGTLTAPRPVDEMLALLSLEQRADVRMLALSGGETRRVDLACALMGNPELVILDEPTTGLDPESRREVWRLVADLRERRRDGARHDALPRGGRDARRPAGDHARGADRPVGTRPPRSRAGHPRRSASPVRPGSPGTRRHQPVTHEPAARPWRRRAADLADRPDAWAAQTGVQPRRPRRRSPSLETVFLSIADGSDQRDNAAAGTPTHQDQPTHQEVGALR